MVECGKVDSVRMSDRVGSAWRVCKKQGEPMIQNRIQKIERIIRQECMPLLPAQHSARPGVDIL